MRRGRSIVTGTAVLLAAFTAGPATAATVWHAAPGGSSRASCSSFDPCSIYRAVDTARDGDTVEVAAGRYDLDSTLDIRKVIVVRGAPGSPRPELVGRSSAPVTVSISGIGYPILSGLRVTSSASHGVAIDVLNSGAQAEIENVDVIASGGSNVGIRLSGLGLVRDTTVRTVSPSSTGVELAAVAHAADVELRNVTAYAVGSTAIAAVARAGFDSEQFEYYCANATLRATNVIARHSGFGADFLARGDSDHGCTSTVNVDHSNGPVKLEGPSGHIVDGEGNQGADPQLVNADFGDFHQLPSSPTIDAGTTDTGDRPPLGPTDIDGDPRVLGAAPDIGADEFRPTTGDGGGSHDTTPPTLTELSLYPSTFEAAQSGPSVGGPKGTLVGYRLSEPAATAFRVERRVPGVKNDGTCKVATSTPSTSKKCVAWKKLPGGFTYAGAAGKNAFRFSGRLNGKRLQPGRYRLFATPRDASGNVGAPRVAKFRIAG